MKKLSIIFVLALIVSQTFIILPYPVSAHTELTIYPSKDTYLFVGAPDGNYGDWATINLCDHTGETDRDCLEFSLTGVPANSTIATATLNLYYSYYDTGHTNPNGKTVWVYKLSRLDWVEAQATWNSYKTGSSWTNPGGDYVTSSPAGASTTFPASFGYMSWNVTAIVEDAYNLGIAAEFLVKFATEGLDTGFSDISFRSKETAAGPVCYPKLIIEYHPSTPSCETIDATSITYNSARINGNITDDGGDTCEARFRWLKSADEPDPEWYGNWSYRKPITVTNASASYQSKILIGKNSSAVGEEVDCNGHIADDFDDLRFTSDDGVTLVDYWIESIADSGGTKLATIWVENNAAANTTLYMYYGGTETALSNGANTFLFFDHFDGTMSKWTGDTAACTIASSIMSIGDTAAAWKRVYSSTSTGATFGIRGSVNFDDYYAQFGAAKTDVSRYALLYRESSIQQILTNDGTAGSVTTNLTLDAYRTFDVIVVGGTNVRGFDNGVEITGSPFTTHPPNEATMKVQLGAQGINVLKCDWVLLRKYIATEPTFAFGAEESYPWTETTWQNSLETGDTFYEDLAGLDSATEYAYQAQARNDAGTTDWTASAYFTTCPAAPTNVSASDGEYTDKVIINWTKSTGATGYKVYRGAVLVDTLGDVATYNDTGADAGIITPGTASATDGVHTDKVTLSLAGESVANGTSHSYTVKAFNDSGDSPASSADDGYRSVGGLSYQWMVSSADADSDYSNIGGAATDPYDYTGAPAGAITPGTADAADGDSPEYIVLILSGAAVSDGAGRYYKCTLSATGAADQNSTSNRGYRSTGALTYQWLVSAGDSDDTYSNLAGATTASHNDTTAPAPTINGGNATASDGTSTTIVTLDLANHNATDGDGRYYLCALSATGTADQNSTSNRGYRGTTSLILQWLMSAADSDADYSNIAGGTTNPYNDTGGVTEPDGRYYKCMVNMTGAATQNSTPDRGYMLLIEAPNVTNSAATDVTGVSATLHGNITAIVGENPSTRGFEWGTSSGNYTSNWTEAGNFTTGTFDYAISGLVPATQYFWRAFAINSAGQGNSSELNFTTLLLPGPPLNFTITQTGSDSISINWTLGVGANGTEIRVSTTGYPGSVTGGFLVYNGTGTSVAINGLNLDMNTYYYEGWSWNAFGYSLTSAQAQIGGAGMEILIFGILPLGFLALFLWKRLALLAYASAATWGLFGFFALQTSTSPSPTQIQDIYMGLFWVCVALVITMALLPLAMREKKEPEELYVDELDQPLEGKQEKKEPTGIRRQKPSQFAQNGKM